MAISEVSGEAIVPRIYCGAAVTIRRSSTRSSSRRGRCRWPGLRRSAASGATACRGTSTAPMLFIMHQAIDCISPLLDRRSSKTPAPPTGVFSLRGAYPSATARRAPTVGRRADRPHRGRRASRRALHRRGARACAGAIRRVSAGSPPRPGRAGHNRHAACSGSGGRPRRSNSIMVLRARRGGAGSKYLTLRGGVRRAIPFLLVRSAGAGRKVPLFYASKTVRRACLLPRKQGRRR